MKTVTLIAIAATTLAASLAASAETYIYPQATNGETTRAEVRAELQDALAHGAVPRGEFAYVAPRIGQPKTRDEVRTELASARANQELARGEFAYLPQPDERRQSSLAQRGAGHLLR